MLLATRRALAGLGSRTVRPLSTGTLSFPGIARRLEDIVKLELLKDEEPARVSAIWDSYHDNKPALAGTRLDSSEYEQLWERACESPAFVFPIRRDGGHFMLYCQFAKAERMFVLTYLEEYRTNPQLAQSWASVHLFDELLDTKAIALIRAEVSPDRLTETEAEHLLLLIRRYYATSSYDRVWTFNHAERHFDIGAYLASCP